ncbi:MAG: mechanosensitive ion channel family protein [Rhizobiaceae bacterium]|nr:mechanosensitive ion channel family protein [Rhizobiaceae bacterium]MCV0406145.1 mechanosensitive ion channel family protein [Rhizobiaceae bacterium]
MNDTLHELTAVTDAVPPWAASVVIFALAVGAAILVHRYVFAAFTRLVARRDLFWRSLVSRTGRPLLLAVIMLALLAASAIAPLTNFQTLILRRALVIALVVLVAQTASAALHIWTTVHLRRFKLDSEDNLLARKHVTQTRILRRVADILIVIVAVGAVLMTFESVRQYGVSLLASAGVAGIILGLALQTVLKNLFAGIQLAITQPIRIDDVLIVEGEWGRVEEITATYVVVQIWDWRRLVVPLSYFIEKPFQNWTRESASIIGQVTIPLDYRAPIDAIRRKAREIAEASPLWDRDVFSVQVVEFGESAMQLRVIISARDAGRAWNLRCDIREKLVTWLQAEYPEALPVTRVELPRGQERTESSTPADWPLHADKA